MDRDSDTGTQRELSLEFRARQQTASSGAQGRVTATNQTSSETKREKIRESSLCFYDWRERFIKAARVVRICTE